MVLEASEEVSENRPVSIWFPDLTNDEKTNDLERQISPSVCHVGERFALQESALDGWEFKNALPSAPTPPHFWIFIPAYCS